CQSNSPIQLATKFPGGVFSGSALLAGNTFTPSAVGKYSVVYTIGKGTCEMKDTVNIEVQEASAKVEPLVLCVYSNLTKITASPAGGRFYSTDCPTCVDSIGNFDVKKLAPLNSAKVFYVYKNPLGCSGEFSTTVSVEEPVSDFNIIKACEGEPVELEFDKAKGRTLEWYLDGKQVDLQDIKNLSYGQHTLKLIAKSANCESIKEKTIDVVNRPRLTKFSYLLSSICAPADVTFTPTPAEQPNMNYTWDFGRMPNDSLKIFQPPVLHYDPKTFSSTIIKIGLVTANGCGSLSFDTSFQLKALPLADVQMDSSLIGCSPYEVVLTNRSLGEIDSCYWDLGNGQIYTKCASFVKAKFITPDSTKIFKPRLFTYNICGVKSDTIEIKVLPPGIKAFFNTDKYLVCPFDTITFTDASTPKPEKVVWFFGDGGTAQIPKPSHAFNYSDSIFKITLRAYGKCGFDTISHTLQTKKAPLVNFEIPNYACQDKEITVKNLSPQNLWKYEWTLSNGLMYSDKYNLIHTFKNGNTKEKIKLKVFDFEGCFNELAKEMPIREKPKADFEVVNDFGCKPFNVQFINKSQNADTYLWHFGDGNSSDIKNPKHTYTDTLAKSYTVKLVAIYDNNCIDSISQFGLLHIYDCKCYVPNIFTPDLEDGINDYFDVYGNNSLVEVESMEIFDRWGDKVYKGKDLLPNGNGNGWDGKFCGKPALPGVYVYKITVEFIDGSKKVLKGDVTLLR
ncbi:MAG: PKD domain-containing protein, partial [Saprospiraceae bacterium]